MTRTLLIALGCCFCTLAAQAQPASPRRAGEGPVQADANVAAAMREAAERLLESVRGDPEFSEALRQFSMEDELLLAHADPARRDWSYWPRERVGLKFDVMHTKHRALAHELLWSAASVVGYHKILNIMQLENILQPTSATGFPRGIEEYTVTLFGEPSAEAPWAWRFEGHHVSLNISVVPGMGVSVTPTFLGADPAEVGFGPLAGVRVLRVEEDLARELVTSLNESQRAKAILRGDPRLNADVAKFGLVYPDNTPWDLVASNIMKTPDQWDSWRNDLRPDGINVPDLNLEQRALVAALIQEVLGTYRPEIAAEYWRKIDLDSLSFAWIGGLNRKEPHYYRIQGPDFLFEYDNAQGGGNHIHSVWRSRAGDFGDDLLERHYAQSH
ncbi:MAG TPA: DUF3500 domain-containing protein [Gammaproteobacteria bacterium]|nr:DUF3500 domain-containing protein [Gammaproteobacteria bacterium]